MRDFSLIMSAIFWGFWNPLPPLSAFVSNWLTPLAPLSAMSTFGYPTPRMGEAGGSKEKKEQDEQEEEKKGLIMICFIG